MPKAVAGFFCDDARQEINGKFFFIGSYSAVMNVPKFPFVGRVSGVAILDGPMSEISKVTCRYKFDGQDISKVELEFEAQPVLGPRIPDHSVFPCPPQFFRAEKPSLLELWIGVNGGRSRKICSLAIEPPDTDPWPDEVEYSPGVSETVSHD